MWGRPHCFGEVSQDLGIQPVGLGQLTCGSGKVPDLAGVDQGQGQPSTSQSSSYRHLETTRGLQHHQLWVEWRQSLDYLSDTRKIVSHAPGISGRTYSYIQPVLGHIDPYVRTFSFQ
jgi:hypothetical protein